MNVRKCTPPLFTQARIAAAFVIIQLFFRVSSVFAQDDEWYLGKPIEKITFDGLNHVKLSDLEGVTGQYVAKTFTDELFWELTGQLYALELFEDINPSAVPADPLGSAVIIHFTVAERPFVSNITFEGNKGLRRSELLDVISLKPNDVVNQLKIRVDEQAVHDKYLEKGFPDARVRAETSTDKNGSIKVVFIINEGDKITIEAIQFEGNSVFSSNTLQNQMTLKKKNLLINDGAFQEAKLIADRAAIDRFYHDRGYIDAEVTDVTREIRSDSKGNYLTLVFHIYEGAVYTFGGVSFTGNNIFSTEDLQKLIYSKTGEAVNAGRLEQDLQRVADLYFENGYIFNTIGRDEQRNTITRTISYSVPIVERGRAHIERIIVRGNKKTKDYVILREIPLEPGDVFSKTKVMTGLRNLYNLQYFSNVFPDTPQGSADSLMDLIINVDEQPTTDIQVGLSFSGSSDPDAFPVSLIFKWNDRNFRGTGNITGVEINAAPEIQSFSLRYTHRWLFGLPLSGGFDLSLQHAQRLAAMDNQAPFFNGDEDKAFPDGFSSFEEYDNAGKLPSDAFLMKYEQWNVSLGFSTGYRWNIPFGILSLGGSIRAGIRYNDFDGEIYRAFDPSIRNRNKQWTPSDSIAVSLSLDDRDIYYDPSRGFYLSERLGLYGLLPNNAELEYYSRSDTKAEWFHTLWNWQVSEKWAFKGVFGIHTGLSLIFPMPFYEQPIIEDANKLSIDGMFIGRGWTGERLNRGLALWENWAEIRMPVFPGILALDLFFDAAARRPKPSEMFKERSSEGHTLADDMRYSFGAGLRFAMPQFPFRFLFLKRFSTPNGVFTWQRGALGGKPGDDGSSGIDFVISFAISTY
ncbi:MAG: outer membrane protein assembly factor BamA [Spirochaetaceae bacterium]|nr:outer membrane protein assembly factor BamA [Spirochaetaceae bacterium]